MGGPRRSLGESHEAGTDGSKSIITLTKIKDFGRILLRSVIFYLFITISTFDVFTTFEHITS